MDVQHTPGPWSFVVGEPTMKITEHPSGDQWNAGGIEIAPIHLRLSWGDRYYGEKGRSVANARLIAAAPDLLEALVKTTGYLADFAFSCGGPATEDEDDEWAAIRNARAAIARATGKDA